MIISHTHRFVFIKAGKVGGTSVQYALANQCDEMDFVTQVVGCDLGGLPKPYGNDTQLSGHYPWPNVKRMVGPQIWAEYLKVVQVRNPWDMMVSWFFHNKRKSHDPVMPKVFSNFVPWHIEGSCPINKEHWLDGNLQWPDFFIRFEMLDEDCRRLFEVLGLEYKGLPQLRASKKRRHFSEFYTPFTAKLVAKKYASVIERFGYTLKDGS